MALSTNVNSPRSNITSYVGRTTTLPCYAPSYISVGAVEWTRRDQSRYVLLNRDGHVDRYNQHPSFKKRVGLKNKDMEDGDLSLVLEDTEPDDSGIYECRYKERTTRPRRGVLAGHPVSVIDLKVEREQHVLAHPGEDIILPCRASRDASVGAVEWVRADLESGGYVLLMRDGIPDTTYQHFSYRDRVELQDDSLKDGNLSLILKNVRSSDMGTFVCRLKESGERGRRSTIQSEPVSIIHLKVADPVQSITVRAGDSVTLPCRAPAETNVDALEWTRPDLEEQGYVYFMRDGLPDLTRQHPSYKNRAELRSRRLKRGDLSLVLKDVSSSDMGTYECRLKRREQRKKKSVISTPPVSIIQLMVLGLGASEEEEEDEEKEKGKSLENIPNKEAMRGRPGLYVGLSLGGIAVAVLGFLLFFP